MASFPIFISPGNMFFAQNNMKWTKWCWMPNLIPRFCPNVSELQVAWHNRNELQAPQHQTCQHRGIKYAHCKRILRPLPLPAPQPQPRLQESSYLKREQRNKKQGFPMNSLRAPTHKNKPRSHPCYLFLQVIRCTGATLKRGRTGKL